ncbi:hypothetical protein FRB91_004122 [Serendipita sp. 411]|nr:hypothetical protein FRB91_004122 [Serendipita sp. 411]
MFVFSEVMPHAQTEPDKGRKTLEIATKTPALTMEGSSSSEVDPTPLPKYTEHPDTNMSDSDEEMFSVARETESSRLRVPSTNKSLDTLQQTIDTNIHNSESSDDEGQAQRTHTLDLLDRIEHMYRLLDLISDQGTGGAVDKVIIAQDSIAKFANRIHTGSYISMTKVNFHALDKHRIRPRGIYGSISAIADFLLKLGCIDEEVHDLLVQPRDESSGVSRPTLRPGLYIINATEIVEPDLFHVIFWPEDDTWVDGVVSAASRNRVTFMRYLTKLCDQVVCLISDEHSQNLEWKEDTAIAIPDDDPETESQDLYDRLFSFSVKQTNDQEETVTAKEGFTLKHTIIAEQERPPKKYPEHFPIDALQPRVLVGDLNQAIMRVDYVPEEIEKTKVVWRLKRSIMEDKLTEIKTPVIRLHPNIDRDSLEHLLELGIGTRCGKVEEEWKRRIEIDEQFRENERRQQSKSEYAKIDRTLETLSKGLPFWLVRKTIEHYGSISEEMLITAVLGDQKRTIGAEDVSNGIRDVETFLSRNEILRSRIMVPFRQDISKLETDYYSRFNILKRQFRQVYHTIETNPGMPDGQIQSLVDIIIYSSYDFQREIRKRSPMGSPTLLGTFADVIKRAAGYETSVYRPLTDLEQIDDVLFVRQVTTISTAMPVYMEAARQITKEVIEALRKKSQRVYKHALDIFKTHMWNDVETSVNRAFKERKSRELEEAWHKLREDMGSVLSVSSATSKTCLLIRSVTRESQSSWSMKKTDTFCLKGVWAEPNNSGFHYAIHRLEIRSDDIQKVTTDPSHVCQPFVQNAPSTTFTLPLPTSLRFIRLIGKDYCLAVVEDKDCLKIYFDLIDAIGVHIENDKHKKRFPFEKIGRNHNFAVDERKRLFALVATHSKSVNIHVYIYEPESKTFNARGTAINVTKWYPRGIPTFSSISFVPGTEELVLADQSGLCRLFYLTTETFRPSTLQLQSAPLSLTSTSDGACMLALEEDDLGGPLLRAFHWASFGTTNGIRIDLPEEFTINAPLTVTSVGHQNSNHVVFLQPWNNTCSSIVLRITRMSTEFEFAAHDTSVNAKEQAKSINNTLIDCHSEVWTRFPILPSIVRQTTINARPVPRSILFVSSESSHLFQTYFSTMVAEFEHKTRKPTRRVLSQIKVQAEADWDPYHSMEGISSFEAGDWLVGLFCLIPIHIAITRANRFVPLKDGVISSAYDQSLLGVSVSEIAESISFGWYESIFNSYLASKPVKVVTSMGEQSVGKSYALNHFMDTSFAGSAMRCTEGVWLSVTPTRDTLFVVMDFEGVHSIERSSQEDALLVLLNTAISNFVLFRNNFALSRDIAELFTSFQSCTTILDPTSNPNLFQSQLIIVVKDVISSDAKEIKNEFGQKFARIVQQERGQNFITKLHRGQLDIIPWPVIESSQFYTLFDILRDRLIRRPITHKHAIMFVDILKTLMAKLKANDWGALDQNLALQRAEYLSSVLATALAFGTSDPNTGEPLKNCDTDEALEEGQADNIFYVPSVVDPTTEEPLIPEFCLHDLRMTWEKRRSRFDMDEQIFLQEYNAHLQELADQRISYVRQWLTQNTLRFGEKAEITAVMRRLDGLAKELKAAVVLCGISCAKCGLLCLKQKYHTGSHDCHTAHLCHRICTFADQHDPKSEIPSCDMPAGHAGKHVCKSLPHLCGAPCDLHERDGCMKNCSKPSDHDDGEHLCPAPVHACGEPCGLVLADGTPLCRRTCVVDSRRPHDRHCCERVLDCPMRCQMGCGSRCAHHDHFHALEEGVLHLCGQDHVCPHDCEDEGVCEIATKPQKIESVFVGKKDTFQYTKYTQEARKIKCCIMIPWDALRHEGRHVHSTDPASFHYCEETCEHCGYYCTLPLKHPQIEHETSHGSMSQTEWFVEGDDDAAVNLDGHRFATGDTGAPMLCNMFCKSQGRHAHISPCRADEEDGCNEEGVEHIEDDMGDDAHDWITHRLFWARSGFKDPYTNAELQEFALCDRRCGGEEHDPTVNPGAAPSLCQLPLFHPPALPDDAPVSGHVSHDGHVYNCKSPATLRRSFHIFFALDRSGSMRLTDCRPLANTPASERISENADNRFGAALSSIYGFWLAREGTQRPGHAEVLQDAYTVVAFDHEAAVMCSNDVGSRADDLLDMLPADATEDGGTNFTQALRLLQRELETAGPSERYPVVIFMSDGECRFDEEAAYDLCRAAVRMGKPLAFHTVAFAGENAGSVYLERMTNIAREIFEAAPADPLIPPGVNHCSFHNAVDTVQLANTYLSIADSLFNPRAALRLRRA